jgi:hypothetical protein
MNRRLKQPPQTREGDWFGRLLADIRKAATATTVLDARAVGRCARRQVGVAGVAHGMKRSRGSKTGTAQTRPSEETRHGATA